MFSDILFQRTPNFEPLVFQDAGGYGVDKDMCPSGANAALEDWTVTVS